MSEQQITVQKPDEKKRLIRAIIILVVIWGAGEVLSQYLTLINPGLIGWSELGLWVILLAWAGCGVWPTYRRWWKRRESE